MFRRCFWPRSARCRGARGRNHRGGAAMLLSRLRVGNAYPVHLNELRGNVFVVRQLCEC